jgi:hypothetical protein
MPRPLTHPQRLQNAAFLTALRQTGNARLAARELGLNRSTFTKRRAKHAACAADWDATRAAAHAAFTLSGGERPPEPGHAPDPNILAVTDAPEWRATLRTKGGEPTITRTASGRLQLRLSPPGRLTRASAQAFLTALAATANVRLAAAAIGVAHTSIYAKRKADPVFARAMEQARRIGLERLEQAMLAAAAAAMDAEGPDAAWQYSVDANPIPPLTAAQALQLLARHKRNEQHDEVDAIMRRRLPWELKRQLLQARLEREKRKEREAAARAKRAKARAKRYEKTGDWRHEDEPAPLILPPLDQVTGWSKADARKKPHREGGTLFGGWRIGDWKKLG